MSLFVFGRFSHDPGSRLAEILCTTTTPKKHFDKNKILMLF